MAKSNLENLLKIAATPPSAAEAEKNPRLKMVQQKAFHDVTRELVRELTSPNQTVREQVGIQEYFCGCKGVTMYEDWDGSLMICVGD